MIFTIGFVLVVAVVLILLLAFIGDGREFARNYVSERSEGAQFKSTKNTYAIIGGAIGLVAGMLLCEWFTSRLGYQRQYTRHHQNADWDN